MVTAVRAYYEETTERVFEPCWSPERGGIHFGLASALDETLEQAIANTNRLVADALELAPGMRCLDAGCGVGGTAIQLALDRGVEVVGVTLSPAQRDRAEARAVAAGVAGRARFLVADYASTGLSAGDLDAAWTLESFCHAEEPEGVLSHIGALLRPGGRFACVDLFRGGAGDPENTAAVCEGWHLPRLLARERVGEAMARAGFIDVRGEDLTERVLRSASTVIALAAPKLLKVAFDRQFVGIRDDVMEGHLRGALGCARGFFDGSMTYGIVTGRRPG